MVSVAVGQTIMQPGRSIEAASRGAGCIQPVQPCVCHPAAERAERFPCPDDCARCGNAQRIRSGLGEAMLRRTGSVWTGTPLLPKRSGEIERCTAIRVLTTRSILSE